MSERKSLYAQQDAIRRIIDRGEWKHSWHLPKDSFGHISWSSPKTAEAIVALMESARKEAIALLIAVESIDLSYAKEAIEDAKEEAKVGA